MAYEDFHYNHYIDDHRGGYNAAADRTENRQLVYKTPPGYIKQLDSLARRLWTLNNSPGRAKALYDQCDDYIRHRSRLPVSGCLEKMIDVVQARWSTRTREFCKAFAVRYAMHFYNQPQYMTEEPEMSTGRTFHPHTILTYPLTGGGAVRAVFDPEFFKVKKGDTVVIDTDPNNEDASAGLRVARVSNDPESYEGACTVVTVDRLDMEQYAVRKEQTAKRNRARALLQEATKRTSEADLFERVKGKLTPDEAALIKEALGYGDAPAAAAD